MSARRAAVRKKLSGARRALFFLALLVLSAAPACAAADEPELRLLAWADYVDADTVIRPFERETGVRVRYDAFSTSGEMLERLAAGEAYDVVFASDCTLNAAREAGLMLRLDKSRLSNWQNLDPAFLGQFFDPESAYAVPYIAGGPLILYDPASTGFEISRLADLWDPALKKKVGLVDDARVTVGMALQSLGERLNEAGEAALAAAGKRLAALAPNVRALGYETLHEGVLSGELAAACTYTPFAALALEQRPDLRAVYPEEGVGFGIDGCFIPANAPHAGNAHAFLDFLLRPETGAAIARRHYSLCPNVPARALLGAWYRENPAFAGLHERLGEAEYLLDLAPEEERRFQEVWAAFLRAL